VIRDHGCMLQFPGCCNIVGLYVSGRNLVLQITTIAKVFVAHNVNMLCTLPHKITMP
jgi:hypothetical protein